ncbi:hypothetical protein HK103_006234 [Boothiomyces macroporosus]|uniref:ENTH domain-containing protein n=1 Tax=Boothiomyces macroporosus TaxID=261099 RepID=A0AAD5UI45_9FUNG|nr:hypothetical protein HK103_006234 [Boothiomyces macroporosus]
MLKSYLRKAKSAFASNTTNLVRTATQNDSNLPTEKQLMEIYKLIPDKKNQQQIYTVLLTRLKSKKEMHVYKALLIVLFLVGNKVGLEWIDERVFGYLKSKWGGRIGDTIDEINSIAGIDMDHIEFAEDFERDSIDSTTESTVGEFPKTNLKSVSYPNFPSSSSLPRSPSQFKSSPLLSSQPIQNEGSQFSSVAIPTQITPFTSSPLSERPGSPTSMVNSRVGSLMRTAPRGISSITGLNLSKSNSYPNSTKRLFDLPLSKSPEPQTLQRTQISKSSRSSYYKIITKYQSHLQYPSIDRSTNSHPISMYETNSTGTTFPVEKLYKEPNVIELLEWIQDTRKNGNSGYLDKLLLVHLSMVKEKYLNEFGKEIQDFST